LTNIVNTHLEYAINWQKLYSGVLWAITVHVLCADRWKMRFCATQHQCTGHPKW